MIINACSYVADKIRNACGGAKERKEPTEKYQCAFSGGQLNGVEGNVVKKAPEGGVQAESDGPVCRRGGGG